MSGFHICAVRQPPQHYSTALLDRLRIERGRRSEQSMAADRRVGVAMDFSPCCKVALRWAVENVVRDGDHLIVVNVQKEGSYEEGEMQLWETTGSPFIPLTDFSDPGIAKKYGVKPDAETLDILNTIARQKEVVVLMKIYWGDAREKICEAIDSIPLSCLIIGNRGHGGIKRLLLGSVSNHVVNNGTCPVTVVKGVDH
ncbi:Universal stress protein family [Musa troglodytarum]|uniref:Universal stress protein family n=1 Tax=Musa troglodytarum TaxID=320322 RepID=A0A9E7EME0_9LILI|nr:Universal stress protein family [Musa troglodytarum]